MWNSFRKKCYRKRSKSVSLGNRGTSEHSKGARLWHFSQTGQKEGCSERVYSEPIKRKNTDYNMQSIKKGRNNSLKLYCGYRSVSKGSIRSLDSDEDLHTPDKNPQDFASKRDAVCQDDCGMDNSSNASCSPCLMRRVAICAELEKITVVGNGESLLNRHRNLIIRDYLESLHYL